MKDLKSVIRYIGYRSGANGGRRFDFAVSQDLAITTTITIEATPDLFLGPDRIALQEASAICYETLKSRMRNVSGCPPQQFDLTATDVVQHRKPQKSRMGKQN